VCQNDEIEFHGKSSAALIFAILDIMRIVNRKTFREDKANRGCGDSRQKLF
jgi:hypothetical protein